MDEESSSEELPEIPPSSITIAVFCALPYEAVAVRSTLDDEFTCRPESIGPKKFVYSFGRIGDHHVVITRPHDMGTVKAAQCATTVSHQFPNVCLALMVGIGAGIPHLPKFDIRLGDLVVSVPRDGHPGVIQYDFVKYEKDKVTLKGCLDKPPPILISADGSLQEDEMMGKYPLKKALGRLTKIPMFKRPDTEDILFDGSFHHIVKGSDCNSCNASSDKKVISRPPRQNNGQPVIHRGLILSGSGVVKSPQDRSHLQHHVKDALCFEMEAAGIMDEIPCLVVRGICDYADTHKQDEWHHYAAAVAAAYCKALLRKIDSQDVEGVTNMSELLEGMRGLAEEVNKIQDAQRHDSIDQKLLLESLRPIQEASFDSYRLEDQGECLEGTRTELLSQIATWGSALSGPCIFWLDGWAGTGKSTISRTAAASFRRRGILAASFFFKRGAGDQSNARRLFPTISWQLASTIPSLASSIKQTIEKDPGISAKMIDKQFNLLLLEPFRLLAKHERKKACYVIVIDALDECEQEEDIEMILKLLPLVRNIDLLDIRFFLTSRPELPTALGLRGIQKDDRHYIVLQEIPHPIILRDISLFLDYKLSKIKDNRSLAKDWPGEEKFQRLVLIAVPLFIFAATICRFLEDLRWSPEDRLNEFLESPATRSASEMERTYVPILNQLLTGRNDIESKRLKREFHEIIGVLILLAEPLSVQALANLVNQSERNVRIRLESFRSVLSVSKKSNVPVKSLHLSFRDFLVNTRQDFRIEEPGMHAVITSHCIRVMEKGLKQNICGLQSYGTKRKDIDRHVLRQSISAELRYCCRYWIHHLERASSRPSTINVLEFLKRHFLHWLEVMSLIGLVTDTLNMVSALKMRFELDTPLDLSEFLIDSKRFITQITVMANLAPLQVYCSGLVFAPVSSTIRRMFENSQVGLQFLPQITNSWSAELQTLEGHSKAVTSVAFSEDGQIIVSGSRDHTIRIWDVNSGLEIRKLEGHSGPVNSVAFSSEDIHILASGSDDCTIKLWNIKTGLLIQSLIVSEPVNLVTSLSTNRSIMASSSGLSTITVWNMQDKSEIWTCKHPGTSRFWRPEKVDLLFFSSDGQTLVSASRQDNQIWDVKTGSEIPRTRESPNSTNCLSERRLIPLKARSGGIAVLDMKTGLETMEMINSIRDIDWDSLAIAQQRQIVAGGSRWNDIVLRDINTGQQIRRLKSHSAGILSMAFSEDCQILASSSSDCTIKLWDVETSLKVDTVSGHLSKITSVAVSIDGEMIASAGGDIKLWDAKTGTELRTLRGHSSSIYSLAFSKDGQKLISGTLDSPAKLWDVKTGAELHTLKHGYMVSSVAFSADDRIVATGSGTNTVKLWDTMTGSEISTLEEPVPPNDEDEVSPIRRSYIVTSIVFSSDGNMVAATVGSGEIRLWNMHNQSEIRTIYCRYGRGGLLTSLAFSRDGEILVVGSYDDIAIWDVKTGSKLREMGFREAEWVALSEDEQMVIAGSDQDGIRIWDINTGLETRVRKDDLTDRNGAGASCQITVDQDWIEFEGEPILWLPKKYRHYSCSVSQKSTLVLGYPSGEVLIMKFS